MFWRFASILKIGGIVAAFILALRTGWPGAAALAATLAGLLCSVVMEGTSKGD
jgi:hypothetical protein